MKKQVAKEGSKSSTLPMDSIDEDTMLDEVQFLDLIKCIDKGLRALPATGQVGSLHRCIGLNASHSQWRHGLARQSLGCTSGLPWACLPCQPLAGGSCRRTVHGFLKRPQVVCLAQSSQGRATVLPMAWYRV